MFGAEGEDLKSQFGRMCRAFGIAHRIAPTPQAKGKVERAMRTFQHRLVVTLRAEGVTAPEPANAVAAHHIDFWNTHHANDEIYATPDARTAELVAAGQCRLRPAPDVHVLRLFLSQHVARRVESRCRIDFMGRKWAITPTLRQYVWLAVRPLERGFYVLETKPDPTNPVIPPILAKYRSEKTQPFRQHRVGHRLMSNHHPFPLLLAREFHFCAHANRRGENLLAGAGGEG